MKRRFRRGALLSAFAALCLAQDSPTDLSPPVSSPASSPEIAVAGKSQRDRILAAEMAENRKESAQLMALAQQLNGDIQKNSQYVFSLADVRKAEDIEKLAHKIRTRMQHY